MIVGSHGGRGIRDTVDIPLEGYQVGQASARHRAAASAKSERIKESGARQIATKENSRVAGDRMAFVVDRRMRAQKKPLARVSETAASSKVGSRRSKVVVMMEGPDKWRPHVRKAVCENQTVVGFLFFIFFGPESQLSFATCSMAHPRYYFPGARAKKFQKGQGLAPGSRVSHRMGSMQHELRLGHLLQDLPD